MDAESIILPPAGSVRRTVLRLVLALAASFALFYGFLLIRFHTGTVRLTRNIAAERNASVLALPEDRRAWTQYRSITLAMEVADQDIESEWGALRPGDPLWPRAAAYLERIAPSLEQIRRATEIPDIGAILTDQPDTASAYTEHRTDPMPGPPTGNPYAMNLLMPHLGKSRAIGRLLREDLYLAVERTDAPRAEDDVRSAARLAGQLLASDGTMIEQLVGIAVLTLASDLAQHVIVNRPDLLADRAWAAVDADLAQAARRTPISFTAERDMLADLEQRLYTDDGSGDGYLNADGLAALAELQSKPRRLEPDQQIFGPFMTLSTSRKRFRRLSDYFYGLIEARAADEPWQRDPEYIEDIFDSSLSQSERGSYEHRILSILIPAVGKAIRARDQVDSAVHGTRTAIALARHRLKHGAYPESLSAIDPDLLTDPAPPDVFDGRPLRYRLIDGWPVVYSIGNNLQDDGGTPPPRENIDAFAPRNPSDGDWILFPPVETNAERLITSPGPWPAERRAR